MKGAARCKTGGVSSAVEPGRAGGRRGLLREEGIQDGRWGLIDLGDIMVHIFQEHMRDFYDLEGLWHDAPRYRVEDTTI